MAALLMISTAGSTREAQRIARNLVERGLAACVNVIPGATSFFSWQGKVVRAKEAVLLIKTVSRNTRPLVDAIKKNHRYAVPEIIFFKVDGGEKEYLSWVQRAASQKTRP
jgi:periplasmic divalent cation tolerance protein